MYTKFFFLSLLCTLFTVGCTGTMEPEPGQKITLNEKSLKLVRASNTFSFALLNKTLDGQAENRMISPLSVSMALSMTLNGASGTTLTAIQNTLGFGGLTREEINTVCKELTDALVKADPSVAMKIANSIWIKKDFGVLEPFVIANQTYFNAQVSRLDFDISAISTINKWVSDHTNGKIPTIIESISSDEVMFLINAIYFNGKWKYRFETAKTVNEPFTLTDRNIVNVPMMKMENNFGYALRQGYKALKMPYGADKFQMVFLLPDAGNTPDKVASALNDAEWSSLTEELASESKVPVWIPKWKFSWEKTLNEILSDMGMKVAFESNNADFSAINPTAKPYISKVIHKTFIDVSETGTEAAAVTSVGIGVTSIPAEPKTFYLNRPFLFFIMEEDTGAILFAGKVENPLVTK